MTTYTDVFERKEVKYRLNVHQYCAIRRALAGRMLPDEYGRVHVSSLYFDTSDRHLIDRSLEKPLYKEKLRLRWYGVPQEDDRVFLEIKKKFKGIVYKRRVGCSYAAARAYLGGLPYLQACAEFPLADELMSSEATSPRSLQIVGEIDQFITYYQPLRPSMLIACDRTAYAPVDQLTCDGSKVAAALGVDAGQTGAAGNLRITFDESIAYRDLFEPSGRGSCPHQAALIKPDEAIMEIKVAGPFPLWLVHALDACKAYPSSFSKYGAAYQGCVRAGRGSTRASRAAFDQASERLAPSVQGAAPRYYRAPHHATKKGGCCA